MSEVSEIDVLSRPPGWTRHEHENGDIRYEATVGALKLVTCQLLDGSYYWKVKAQEAYEYAQGTQDSLEAAQGRAFAVAGAM